jgi:leucyl aminopeptidase
MIHLQYVNSLTAFKKQDNIVICYKHVDGKLTLLYSRQHLISEAQKKHILEILDKYSTNDKDGGSIHRYLAHYDELLQTISNNFFFLSLNNTKEQCYAYPQTTESSLLRDAFASLARLFDSIEKKDCVAIVTPYESEEQLFTIAEACFLGAYSFKRYLSKEKESKIEERHYNFYGETTLKNASEIITKAQTIAEAVYLTRDMVNMPNNILTTESFVSEIEKLSEDVEALKFKKFDSEYLEKNGFNGIIAVGKGSNNPPYLVRLKYTPVKSAKTELALVGKGVMFDSGGLSLKPADYMMTMKEDMAGAATAFSTILCVAKLGLKVNITAWLPIVENMPSSSATRPGDVVKMYNKKSVEILNTDAEGRLILADALAVCCEKDKPKYLIDIATLTGAMAVGLGNRVSGLMGDSSLIGLTKKTGEAVWPMPLPAEMLETFKSKIADLTNLGARYGGGLAAGSFLREFVDKSVIWTHLDIAGTAFNEQEAYGITPKMATGVIVRSLISYAESLSVN